MHSKFPSLRKAEAANSRGTFAGKARGTRAWKTSLKVLDNHVTLLKTGRQKCVTKAWTRPWQFPQLQLVSLRTAWLTTQMWLCSGRKCVAFFFFFSFWTWNRSKNTVTSVMGLCRNGGSKLLMQKWLTETWLLDGRPVFTDKCNLLWGWVFSKRQRAYSQYYSFVQHRITSEDRHTTNHCSSSSHSGSPAGPEGSTREDHFDCPSFLFEGIVAK